MPDSSSIPAPGRCVDCGGPLLEGTCAACAFGWLREEPAGGEETAEAAGAISGRYELLECLARGGMGVVYAARDTRLRRVVALKALRGAVFAGPAEVARFTLETKAAAALDHPSIVPVYEVGEEDGEPFFTMRLIDGESLAARLRARGPLPAREAAALLAPVARAVEHAHGRGVLHRDLKPGNILVDSSGRPWLTDFGLARVSSVDHGLTGSSDTLGTPHYMPPEMASGRAREFTAAGDVWALGVILWEMTAGVPPFTGRSAVEVLQAAARDAPPAPPETLRRHRDLLTLARRCLEKRPADRLASAGLLAEELERFLRGEPILSRQASPPEMLVKWARRRPLHAALLALGAVFLTVASALWLRAESARASLAAGYGELAAARDGLERSLRRATATRLAGEARLLVEENPDRALLLAATATEMSPDGGGPLPEARAALMETLQRAAGMDCTPSPVDTDRPDESLFPPRYYGQTGRISPDSRWLAVVSATEYYLGSRALTAALLDLKSPDRAAPARRWSLANSGNRANFAPAVRWLADSRRLLLVDGNAAVHLLEPAAGLPEGGVTAPDAPVLEESPPSVRLGTLTPPAEGENGGEGITIHSIRITALTGEHSGRARLAVCWRAGPRHTLQVWDAGPEGLRRTGEVRVPLEVPEDAVVTLSPRGRWLVFGARTWMPLTEDGASALVYECDRLTEPPRRLLTDRAEAAARTAASRNLLASGWLEPEFGTAWEPEDMLLLPHPGHGLRVHFLSGLAPGGAVAGAPLPGHTCRLRDFALAPDSSAVAELRQGYGVIVHRLTFHEDSAGVTTETVRLPDAEDGAAVAFCPDSHWIFAARRNKVRAWRLAGLADGQPPLLLPAGAAAVGHIALSPDSRTLFTVGGGWVMRRQPFDGVSAGLNPRETAVPGAAVREIALSPDGLWLAAACEGASRPGAPSRGADTDIPSPGDGQVAAGRVSAPALLPLAAHGDMATGAAFSRDGRWLAAAGGGKVRVWSFPEVAAAADAALPAPRRVFSFTSESMLPQYDARLAWFPDAKLYCVHGGGGDLQWDFTGPDPLSTTLGSAVSSILYQLPALALSPDGRFTAVARHGWDEGLPVPGSPQEGNQVLLFRGDYARHGELLHALRANFRDRTNLAFSPDGRWLAAGGEGRPATLWDLNAPDIAASRREAPVTAGLSAGVAFSPDSRRLAIGTGAGGGGGGAGALHLWEFQNPDASAAVLTIRTPRAVNCVVWRADGRLLTGGGGPSVAVWETDLARLLRMARDSAGRGLTPAERARYGL